MECAITELANTASILHSEKDDDNSVDEDIFFKRNRVKNILDSEDEIDEKLPERTSVMEGESDSESCAGRESVANRTTLKRIVREIDSETEEINEKEIVNHKSDHENESEDGRLDGSPSLAVDSFGASDPPKYKRPSQFSQSDLYDAESSDDERMDNRPSDDREGSPVNDGEDSQEHPRGDSPTGQSNKKKSKVPSKPKPAKNDVQKIYSESQRMVRQSRVSLPYHRPRQRTLADFLNRRKTVIHPTALKTSPTKLGIVWKCLEEKAKEAEQFYKSDSEDSEHDHEDDTNQDGSNGVSKKDDVGAVEINEGSSCQSSVLENQEKNPGILGENSAEVNNELKDVIPDEVNSMDNSHSTAASVLTSGVESPKPSTSNDIDICSESLLPKMDNIGDIQISLSDECPAVSQVQVPSSKTYSDEMERVCETEEQMDTANHRSDDGQIDDIPKILNTILDAVVDKNQNENEINQPPADSVEEPVIKGEPKTDFSNLFTRKASEENDTELHRVKCSSEDGQHTLSDKSSPEVVSIDEEKLDNHSVKVVTLAELDDSESMNLRLDDDSMDEVKSTTIACNDSINPKSGDKETKEDGEGHQKRAPTPVKMLHEIERHSEDSTSGEIPKSPVEGSSADVGENLLLSHLTPVVLPHLEGDPDDVIDLDEDIRKPAKADGMKDLMQRFIKHHIPKPVKNDKKQIDVGIVVVDADGKNGTETVKREVMSVTVEGFDPVKNTPTGVDRPGVGFRTFREELQRDIAKKRDEEWAKRQKEYSLNEDEKMEKEGDMCNLDDEEEEELTDSSSSEEEEEEEDCIEDDVDMTTKSRPKSQYLDDEAEESEDEGNDEESDEENSLGGGEEEEALILEEEVEDKEKQHTEKESAQVEEAAESIQGDINEEAEVDSPALTKVKNFHRSKTFDLFDSEDDDDVDKSIAASARSSPPTTPFGQCRSKAQGCLSLPSPALPLTALQGYMNSPSSGTRSPWVSTQKLVFSEDESPRQLKDENDSLSGKSALRNLIGSSQESQLPEDELLNLMSGAFLSRAEKLNEVDDDFSLALEDTQDDSDKSQLKEKLKEEYELLRSKFGDSKSLLKASWNSLSLSFGDKIDEVGQKDSDMDEELKVVMRRKKLRKLDISDEEDEGESQEVDKAEEEADEGDKTIVQDEGENEDSEEGSGEEEVESEVDEEEDGVVRVVEYDSEENAVVVEEKVRKKRKGARRGLEFLEAEAELSEGEEGGGWHGSGDEDEHGLDQMEKEEGDVDQFDNDIVRRELGRIHMRQVLDEDKREVRLLQEYFLEDGELHSDGQGRERKFRWRNINSVDDGDYRPMNASDDEKAAEEEDADEERWRRLRHEREMWLREQQQKETIEDSESLLSEMGEDSQLLKLGRAALRRINSYPPNALTKWLKPKDDPKEKSEAKKPSENEPESPEVKKPFQMLCKRGSFLARKDGTLEKLAEIAIKSAGGIEQESLTSTSPVVAKTKNSRKFVFTVLSPEKKVPKDNLVPPAASSEPKKMGAKRKKRDPKENSRAVKKSKVISEASIFQFL